MTRPSWHDPRQPATGTGANWPGPLAPWDGGGGPASRTDLPGRAAGSAADALRVRLRDGLRAALTRRLRADEDAVRRLIATAEETFGRIDVLVNNAGFGGKMMPLHEQTSAEWDRIHGLSFKGVFFCMRYGVISMRGTGGGSVVNISSATAMVGFKHHGMYGAVKAGVNQLTRTAALDYGPAGMQCGRLAARATSLDRRQSPESAAMKDDGTYTRVSLQRVYPQQDDVVITGQDDLLYRAVQPQR